MISIFFTSTACAGRQMMALENRRSELFGKIPRLTLANVGLSKLKEIVCRIRFISKDTWICNTLIIRMSENMPYPKEVVCRPIHHQPVRSSKFPSVDAQLPNPIISLHNQAYKQCTRIAHYTIILISNPAMLIAVGTSPFHPSGLPVSYI